MNIYPFRRERKKPKRSKQRLWCPGGGESRDWHWDDSEPERRKKKFIRCKVCDQRFEAEQRACCCPNCIHFKVPRHKAWRREKVAKAHRPTVETNPAPIKCGSSVVTVVGKKNYRDYTPTQRKVAKKRVAKRDRQRGKRDISGELYVP